MLPVTQKIKAYSDGKKKKKKSYSRRKTKVLVGKVENEVIITQKIWKMASIRIGKEST